MKGGYAERTLCGFRRGLGTRCGENGKHSKIAPGVFHCGINYREQIEFKGVSIRFHSIQVDTEDDADL
jgi:hypothetical protein